MTKTPSASVTPYTCSNKKSFWIPVEYTPKICTSYCACQNFIFFFKITFEKHPTVHGWKAMEVRIQMVKGKKYLNWQFVLQYFGNILALTSSHQLKPCPRCTS